MRLKKIFFVIIINMLSFNNVHAIEPDVFVQSTVNRASQVLSKNISTEDKINELKVIAKETVDIDGIGFYSLGSARKELNNLRLHTELLEQRYDLFIKTQTISNMYKN